MGKTGKKVSETKIVRLNNYAVEIVKDYGKSYSLDFKDSLNEILCKNRLEKKQEERLLSKLEEDITGISKDIERQNRCLKTLVSILKIAFLDLLEGNSGVKYLTKNDPAVDEIGRTERLKYQMLFSQISEDSFNQCSR